MAAAPSIEATPGYADEPLHVTLLELVEAVSDVTDSEVEVVATVVHMLESGRVCLSGNLRGVPISSFA